LVGTSKRTDNKYDYFATVKRIGAGFGLVTSGKTVYKRLGWAVETNGNTIEVINSKYTKK